ncbi:MAG: type 4a pilus biogenesis protein PilO [Deltaproteobacteria bacterium]|nr:type 4a pilus biogenesis protein PilO [Deltaproteobacteria bacterium]
MISETLKSRAGIVGIVSLIVIAFNIAYGAIVIERQEEDIARLQASVSRGRGAGLAETSDGIVAFKKTLPDKLGLTKVIDKVLASARANGIKIHEGNYAPETIKDAEFSRYSISLPVEGNYPGIKRFIYELESMRDLIIVEEVSLSGAKGSGSIGLNIRISAYYI